MSIAAPLQPFDRCTVGSLRRRMQVAARSYVLDADLIANEPCMCCNPIKDDLGYTISFTHLFWHVMEHQMRVK